LGLIRDLQFGICDFKLIKKADAKKKKF